MRVAPVGLICAALNPGQNLEDRDNITFELGCELAGLTHGHPSGRLPAGYLSVLIAGLADGKPWAEAHARARRPLAAAEFCAETLGLLDEAIRRAGAAPCDPLSVAALGQGWVAEEALAISVYCAASAVSRFQGGADAFEETLVLAVNHDGDSDSTGSITGNIAGAMFGRRCIPERWLGELELRDVIGEMAEDLATSGVWEVGEYDDSPECDYWWQRYPGH